MHVCREFLESRLLCMYFPGGLDGKESVCNAEDLGLIPRLGRSPREGDLLQYSCLENSMDRVPGQATVHGAAESDMIE